VPAGVPVVSVALLAPLLVITPALFPISAEIVWL
jgi:hypothetical protein